MKGYSPLETPFATNVNYLITMYQLPKSGVIRFLELYSNPLNGVKDFKNTYQFIGKTDPKLLLTELTRRAQFATLKKRGLLNNPLTHTTYGLDTVIAKRVISEDISRRVEHYLEGKQIQKIKRLEEEFGEFKELFAGQQRYQPGHTEERLLARPIKPRTSTIVQVKVPLNELDEIPVTYEVPRSILRRLGFGDVPDDLEKFVYKLCSSDYVDFEEPKLEQDGTHIRVKGAVSGVELIVLEETPYKGENPWVNSSFVGNGSDAQGVHKFYINAFTPDGSLRKDLGIKRKEKTITLR